MAAKGGNVALTRIQHGGTGSWNELTGIFTPDQAPTVFMPGDKVTGLSEDEMASLHEAGAVGTASQYAALTPTEEAEEEAAPEEAPAEG